MSFWTPSNVLDVTGGRWVGKAPGASFDRPVSGVSTDSRSINVGQAFLALKGEKFDGHAFVADVARTAPLLIVSDEAAVKTSLGETRQTAFLLVPDTLAALQALAAAYRRSLPNLKVVGVTGSNGKTTTTRLMDAVLGTSLRGSHSIKSYNNHIGVPLTLLAVRPGDEYVVCEMGMNHAGEIAPLTAMAAPDAAVITSIGRAHVEHLGSIGAIAKEKASIFSGLRPGGLAVVPQGVAPLTPYLGGLSNLKTVGTAPGADVRVARITHQAEGPGDGVAFELADGARFRIPLLGEHNALNAAAAVTVGRFFGIGDESISRGLAGAVPPEMRLARMSIGGVEILNDAYNASPESMLAAFKTFAALSPLPRGRRVLILGDMLELGSESEAAHREVGRWAHELCAPDLMIGVGEAAAGYADGVGAALEWRGFAALDDASAGRVADLLEPGDRVLVKGSRRMGLERIVGALSARARHAASTPV